MGVKNDPHGHYFRKKYGERDMIDGFIAVLIASAAVLVIDRIQARIDRKTQSR
jgi:hypothetical protein